MAFNGYKNTPEKSLFPTNLRRANVNVGGENNGSMALPFVPIPSVSLQEPDTASYVPWSHNAADNPNELINCAQSSKPSGSADCDGDIYLQNLVSNIVDEPESQHSYYSEGNPPFYNSVWSPKTLREEQLPYFQSETKAQHSSNFLPNYASREAFSNTSTSHPQKLPPGLPVPNMGNTYLSQIQQSKYDNMSADTDSGNSQPVNNFPDFSNVFRPQSEMNRPYFDLYYEDHIQSSAKPITNEQYVPQGINQLVSSFQSLVAGEHDSACRDFQNMHRQPVGMYHEDSMVDQWKITDPAMSTQSTSAMQTQNLVGEFGTVQWERYEEVRKQPLKRDGFQDLPGFSPHNTEYFQQPWPLPASLNLPNQYQGKMTLHRDNTSLPINVSMNPYLNHHIQQGQIQNKIQPQMQKEEKRMHMSGFVGESLSTRPKTNTYMREGDKKQAPSQNPFMQTPVNDPRRYSRMPINSSRSVSTLPYGSGLPGIALDDMSANESVAFNSYLSDTVTRRKSTSYGMNAAMTSSVVMDQGGPKIQLNFYLDECYEQWRCLVKGRKRIEVLLTNTFLVKWTAAVTTSYPPNPTRVDHLIVNLMREQAKVATLLDRMECLHNIPIHTNIRTALNRYHEAICVTQARRKEELVNMSKHQRQTAQLTENRDTQMVACALKDLAATTSKLCTALWCHLQVNLLQPVEAACRERCPSPFEGYSFKL